MLWHTHSPATFPYSEADAKRYLCWLGHFNIWQIFLAGELVSNTAASRIELIFVVSSESCYDDYVNLLKRYRAAVVKNEKDEEIRLRAFSAIFGGVSPDLLLGIPGKEPFRPATLSVHVFPDSWRTRAQEIERSQGLPRGTVRACQFQSRVLATATVFITTFGEKNGSYSPN